MQTRKNWENLLPTAGIFSQLYHQNRGIQGSQWYISCGTDRIASTLCEHQPVQKILILAVSVSSEFDVKSYSKHTPPWKKNSSRLKMDGWEEDRFLLG